MVQVGSCGDGKIKARMSRDFRATCTTGGAEADRDKDKTGQIRTSKRSMV